MVPASGDTDTHTHTHTHVPQTPAQGGSLLWSALFSLSTTSERKRKKHEAVARSTRGRGGRRSDVVSP